MQWYKEVEQDDGTVVTVPSTIGEGAAHDRWQIVTIIPPMRVSTVFLGLDHAGMLYETMVFHGDEPHDRWPHGQRSHHQASYDMVRYRTRAEAEHGHAVVCVRWRDIVDAKA